MGRTELQDAVPMTVGQEMHAFAATLEDEVARLRDAEKALYAINMGGTAIGTGMNVPRGFAKPREAPGEADEEAVRARAGPDRGDLEPARGSTSMPTRCAASPRRSRRSRAT